MYQTPESCVWRIFNSNKSCFRAIINNFWIILFGQFHFRSIISISFGNSKKTHWTHHPCWHFLPNNWQFWVLIFGRFSQTLVSYLWVVLTSTSFTQISGLHEYLVLSMAEPLDGIWTWSSSCDQGVFYAMVWHAVPHGQWMGHAAIILSLCKHSASIQIRTGSGVVDDLHHPHPPGLDESQPSTQLQWPMCLH